MRHFLRGSTSLPSSCTSTGLEGPGSASRPRRPPRRRPRRRRCRCSRTRSPWPRSRRRGRCGRAHAGPRRGPTRAPVGLGLAGARPLPPPVPGASARSRPGGEVGVGAGVALGGGDPRRAHRRRRPQASVHPVGMCCQRAFVGRTGVRCVWRVPPAGAPRGCVGHRGALAGGWYLFWLPKRRVRTGWPYSPLPN